MKSLKSTTRTMMLLLLTLGLSSIGLGAEGITDLDPNAGIPAEAASIYRWKDIAANTYAQSYKESYDYEMATMVFAYDPAADSTLRGHLSATNLKPNFAYQLKIAGKPTALWGPAGDDATNERIGYLGRWWRHQPDPGNSNDAEYEAFHDVPGYIFEGYLVFDFFVSDSTGCAEKDLALDSSYHVLWWEHQRSPAVCDSPILWSTVIGHASHPAYEEDVGPASVGVYAEIERNCTGTTTMPAGLYDCRLLLTEESFHQSGEDEGNWQSVSVNDTLFFEITDVTAVDSRGVGFSIISGPLYPNPFLGRTVWRFSLSTVRQVGFSIYDISGRMVRSFPRQTRGAGGHQFWWDGCDDSGRRAASGVYLFRLEAGAFTETKRVVLMK